MYRKDVEPDFKGESNFLAGDFVFFSLNFLGDGEDDLFFLRGELIPDAAGFFMVFYFLMDTAGDAFLESAGEVFFDFGGELLLAIVGEGDLGMFFGLRMPLFLRVLSLLMGGFSVETNSAPVVFLLLYSEGSTVLTYFFSPRVDTTDLLGDVELLLAGEFDASILLVELLFT